MEFHTWALTRVGLACRSAQWHNRPNTYVIILFDLFARGRGKIISSTQLNGDTFDVIIPLQISNYLYPPIILTHAVAPDFIFV